MLPFRIKEFGTGGALENLDLFLPIGGGAAFQQALDVAGAEGILLPLPQARQARHQGHISAYIPLVPSRRW